MHGPEPPAHTIYDVSASTHFGHPPKRALTPAAGRASSTTTRCVAGYSFMFRPTNTLRPGAGENIGRALSQKKLSYQA